MKWINTSIYSDIDHLCIIFSDEYVPSETQQSTDCLHIMGYSTSHQGVHINGTQFCFAFSADVVLNSIQRHGSSESFYSGLSKENLGISSDRNITTVLGRRRSTENIA